MRLCILTEFFHPDSSSGTGKVVSHLARDLHDKFGFEIDVYTSANTYSKSGEETKAQFDWDGIRVTRITAPDYNKKSTPLRFFGNLLLAQGMKKAIGQKPYDAVLVTTAPPVLPSVAAGLKNKFGIPFAYIVYDLEPNRTVALGVLPPNNLAVKLLSHAQRVWLNAADRVIVIGRCMSDLVQQDYGVKLDSVSFIPVGYGGEGSRERGKSSKFRDRNGFHEFLVIYSGNFARYHEFGTMLDAAERLKEDKRIRFVLVGKGYQGEFLKPQIASRGLDNVSMLPFVPDDEYEDLVLSANVSLVSLAPGVEGTCVPSKFYSLMASAAPVIAVMGQNAEVARTILENQCGVTVRQGDVEGFVRELLRLVEDPQLLSEMGRKAGEAFDANYKHETVVSQFNSVLSQMVR